MVPTQSTLGLWSLFLAFVSIACGIGRTTPPPVNDASVTEELDAYACHGGYLCDGSAVTGRPDDEVCGADFRSWKCTSSGWQPLETECSCEAAGGIPVPAGAYYVAKDGDDERSCEEARSEETPRRTISHALECLSAGDTLLVRGGTYDELIDDPPIRGTSWNEKVRIANYPNEAVWLVPTCSTGRPAVRIFGHQQYIEFDGINVSGENCQYNSALAVGCSGESASHHIRWQNSEWTNVYVGAYFVSDTSCVGGNEMRNLRIYQGWVSPTGSTDPCDGLPGQGFYIQSDDNIIDGVDVSEMPGSGFQIYSGNGAPPSRNIVRNSRFHDITNEPACARHWGGTVWGGADNQIYNNVFFNIGGNVGSGSAGLVIGVGSGHLVYNNTIYGNSDAGAVLEKTTTNVSFVNNVVYGNGGGDFVNGCHWYEGCESTVHSNLVGVNPLFVDPSASDFRLQSGSPAIDAGAWLSLVETDIVGVTRLTGAAPDMGAFEHVQ